MGHGQPEVTATEVTGLPLFDTWIAHFDTQDFPSGSPTSHLLVATANAVRADLERRPKEARATDHRGTRRAWVT